MNPTPPGQFPVISDGTTVRFKLGALIGMISTLIAATIWATVFYTQQVRMAVWAERTDDRLERIERALGVSLTQRDNP